MIYPFNILQFQTLMKSMPWHTETVPAAHGGLKP